MKTAQETILLSSAPAKVRLLRRSGTADPLRVATQRMAEILSARGMCVQITLGGNTTIIGDRSSSQGEPVEFLFTSEKVFVRLFRRMRLSNFAIAFFDGHLKLKGPISKAVDILDAMNLSTDRHQSVTEFCGRLIIRSLKVLFPKFPGRFESIDHYSQSAKAYELFLDDYMQYTCGHFPKRDEDINQAQIAKFHLIERLVTKHFGPLIGKSHLDIGCGWGGMGAYFQSQFGMRSIGNTNCRRQMEYAQQLYDSDIIFGDFSDLKKRNLRFDLITIVGMIEHLTPRRRSQLLNVVGNLLKPGGIVYLQCITKPQMWIGGDAYRIAKREIFPGHFLETREQTEARLKNCGFTILEQFEHHSDYALTTSRWVDKIQKNEAALVSILGARQYRMYLGYLAFASKLFSIEGRGSLMRYVFKKA
jgi:cyclopropane fatty-acyl-phospholipid synthase-like methyltransferase